MGHSPGALLQGGFHALGLNGRLGQSRSEQTSPGEILTFEEKSWGGRRETWDFSEGVLSEPPHRPWAAGPFAGCGFAGHSRSRGPRGAGAGGHGDIGIAGPPVHISTGPAPPDGDKRDGRMRRNGLARHLSTSRLPKAPGTQKRLGELHRGNREGEVTIPCIT